MAQHLDFLHVTNLPEKQKRYDENKSKPCIILQIPSNFRKNSVR